MSACTPAAANASLRNLGSSVPHRCELLVSGRMMPTLPGVEPPPLLAEPLLPLLSSPQAATLPTARRPTAARANIPLRITCVLSGESRPCVGIFGCVVGSVAPRDAMDQELLLCPATYSGSGR